MSTSKRVLVAVTALAVAATLALVPGLGASASAAGAAQAASAQCESARSALWSAQASQAKAKAKVAKKKKAVKKAKKAHKVVKVKKAKKQLKKAKKQHRRTVAATSARANTAYAACRVAYTVPGSPAAAGKEVGMLGSFLGGDLLQLLNPQQLLSFLEAIFPDISSLFSPAQLLEMLGGFNASGFPGVEELSKMLGGGFSTAELQELVGALDGGSLDPALLKKFADTVMVHLGGLAGGVAVPSGGFDAGGLADLVDGLIGNLSVGQLGSLVALLKQGLGFLSAIPSTAKLQELLDGLVPGLGEEFSPSELTAMLTAANGSLPGVAELGNLLAGNFSSADLSSLLSEPLDTGLVNQVLAVAVGQLGVRAGGTLPDPTALTGSLLATVADSVTGILNSVLNGIGGGGGGGLCVLLPILC